MEALGDVTAAWEEHAGAWLAWSRTPEHDAYYWQLNLPAFAEMLPPPGRRTLDVGCGEGRLGRWLAERGHRVAGVDSSPTLVDSARRAGGYDEIACADAAALPWPDDAFDLAIAFMSLHDMPDPAAVTHEIARTLSPGAVLCVALIHPLNGSPEHLEDYFSERRFAETVERAGLTMTFHGMDRPLEAYTRPLAAAGFVIEQLREPRPTPDAMQRAPSLARAARTPYFMHLRCRLT